ncbi:hypothetical protein HanIR_Chr16g0792001 [Helianthus annuus]|nr:hypothetical protein HanIR_Chr16g0792001 [Helianthus annuus]
MFSPRNLLNAGLPYDNSSLPMLVPPGKWKRVHRVVDTYGIVSRDLHNNKGGGICSSEVISDIRRMSGLISPFRGVSITNWDSELLQVECDAWWISVLA